MSTSLEALDALKVEDFAERYVRDCTTMKTACQLLVQYQEHVPESVVTGIQELLS